jgi:hypothetical protein
MRFTGKAHDKTEKGKQQTEMKNQKEKRNVWA